MTGPAFASTQDTADKVVSFRAIGPGLYAYTAQGDPNSGIIVGEDACMVIDAQATPAMAQDVIARVRTVTDKPIAYVVLSHYHAVRVFGASAYGAQAILASQATRDLIVERGEQDKASEIGRFPRLFRGEETIPPGLVWPTITFSGEMTVDLGQRRVRLMQIGRGHTAGDIVAYVEDAGVLFSGDLVEYHSACYCGDAHLRDWPGTLDRIKTMEVGALVPGRGDALVGRETVGKALAMTRSFVSTLYGTADQAVARGASLKETFAAVRAAMDPVFGSFAIYEHCLPFNVSRAYDEASGVDHPVIWTAERDRQMWAALQS